MKPFKSKAEIRRATKLLQAGQMEKPEFDKRMALTENAAELPERVSDPKPKVRMVKVIR